MVSFLGAKIHFFSETAGRKGQQTMLVLQKQPANAGKNRLAGRGKRHFLGKNLAVSSFVRTFDPKFTSRFIHEDNPLSCQKARPRSVVGGTPCSSCECPGRQPTCADPIIAYEIRHPEALCQAGGSTATEGSHAFFSPPRGNLTAGTAVVHQEPLQPAPPHLYSQWHLLFVASSYERHQLAHGAAPGSLHD